MDDLRIIKKYPNRRLYDTQVSSYITLEDVRALILERCPIKIVDARTSEDLTRSVLLQIIAEYEERGNPIFSTELLSQLICFYGDAMQGVMGRYLERSLAVFMDQQHQFRSQLNELVGQAPFQMMEDMKMPTPPEPPEKRRKRIRAVGGKPEESE